MTAHKVVALRVRRHGHELRERATLVRAEFACEPMAGLSRRWGELLERHAGESYALARELMAEGERAAWQPEERRTPARGVDTAYRKAADAHAQPAEPGVEP